jgi:hypothetical protein
MVARKKAAASPVAPMTRSDKINALEANREARRKIEAQLKPLEDEYKVLKAELLDDLVNSKEEGARTSTATISVSRILVPVMDDPVQALKYLLKTNNMHVLLNQPFSTPAWRELAVERKVVIPGTHAFEKVDLNHSSTKTS